MAKKRREERWVIFAGPQQPPGGESRYVAKDGKKITKSLREAAEFYTREAALEFAKAEGVTIDGVARQIEQVKWPFGDGR